MVTNSSAAASQTYCGLRRGLRSALTHYFQKPFLFSYIRLLALGPFRNVSSPCAVTWSPRLSGR